MIDYKLTLNLPTTLFPMKANLSQREPEALKRWQENKLYEKLRKRRQGREKFILHDDLLTLTERFILVMPLIRS